MSEFRKILSKNGCSLKKTYSKEICKEEIFGKNVSDKDDMTLLNFIEMEFDDCSFGYLAAHAVQFINCTFKHCIFTEVSAIRPYFDTCRFYGVSVENCTWDSALFKTCSGSVQFINTSLDYANFVNCTAGDFTFMDQCSLIGVMGLESAITANDDGEVLETMKELPSERNAISIERVKEVFADLEEMIYQLKGKLNIDSLHEREKIRDEINAILEAHDQYLLSQQGQAGEFKGYDLSGMDLSNRDLTDMIFVDCNLNEVDFTGSTLYGCSFIQCSMVNTIFYKSVCGEILLRDTDISSIRAEESTKKILNILASKEMNPAKANKTNSIVY